MIRALFYFLRNLHVPGMLPIYHALKSQPDVDIGFCLPYDSYDPNVKAGFHEGEDAELLREPVTIVKDPRDFPSDVVFVADSLAPVVQDSGKIINVGHGLLSKGMFFTDKGYIERENLNHLLIVPGEYHKQRILSSNRVFIPVEAVGYPKIDPIFNGSIGSRGDLCQLANLDVSKKIVLYAPTYNPELSAMHCIGDRVQELAKKDTYLLIKLHGATEPELVEMHRRLANENDNIRFITDADITPYLQLADVMISDVSSAAWEFILLDKPVVFFDNPRWNDFPHYDPDDIEFAWRDVGHSVTDMKGLHTAVNRSLAKPDELTDIRQHYIRQLGIPCDGKASERVVELMRELVSLRLHGIRKDRVGVITESGQFDSKNAASDSVELIDLGNIYTTEDIPDNIEYVLFYRDEVHTWERWLFRLLNHLLIDSTVEAIVPLVYEGPDYQRVGRIFRNGELNGMEYEKADRYLKCALTSQHIQLPGKPGNDVLLIRRNALPIGLTRGNFTERINVHLALDVLVGNTVKLTSADLNIERKNNRIDELVKSIRRGIPKETEPEKNNRMLAEAGLGKARHHLGRRNTLEAVKWARSTLERYPACKSAEKIVTMFENQQLNIVN